MVITLHRHKSRNSSFVLLQFFSLIYTIYLQTVKREKKKQKKMKLNSYIMNPLNVTPNEHFELYLFCYRTESLKEKNICDGKIHKNNFITIPFPWANTNYVSIATFRNKINQNLIIYKKKEIYIMLVLCKFNRYIYIEK